MFYRRSNVDMETKLGYRTTEHERMVEKRIREACADKPVRKVTTRWLIEGQPWRYMDHIASVNKTDSVKMKLINYLKKHGPQPRNNLHLKIGCNRTYIALLIARCPFIKSVRINPSAREHIVSLDAEALANIVDESIRPE